MLELATITLVLAAISNQERDVELDRPFTGVVSSTALRSHPTGSLRAIDHLPQVKERAINTEVQRRQRLLLEHAEKIDALRTERAEVLAR